MTVYRQAERCWVIDPGTGRRGLPPPLPRAELEAAGQMRLPGVA